MICKAINYSVNIVLYICLAGMLCIALGLIYNILREMAKMGYFS